MCISIHSPHARGDFWGGRRRMWMNISIHSPHARGDPRGRPAKDEDEISIHSPHARGDADYPPNPLWQNDFNPLPSCEGRHANGGTLPFLPKISIHSPHARGDVSVNIAGTGKYNFNPLPSCEGRRKALLRSSHSGAFQSTPLMRGETWSDCHSLERY